MQEDPDLAALRKANRRPLWIGLGVVGGAVLIAGVWVAAGAGDVRAALEAEGHTDVDVKIRTPFEYGYTAKKGSASCGGTFTRLPFSTSRSGSCFGVSSEAPRPPAPALPEGERLAAKLRTQFPKLPVSGARCPVIEPGATRVTCAIEADAGAPLDVDLEKKGDEWSIRSPQRILVRDKLASSLSDELQQKLKAPVVVDCGTGLFGYSEKDRLTCSASRVGAKKAGAVVLTFQADGGYSWKAGGV
jgi:hypothetical protein